MSCDARSSSFCHHIVARSFRHGFALIEIAGKLLLLVATTKRPPPFRGEAVSY